ncbi:MAG: efflux RND transporter permease subunit [Candidatus Krumholzibacteriia bacterium]
MFLSNLSIRRPVVATVMMLALVTLGLFSYRRLSIDMYPDVEIPVMSIVTIYPGASPETVEREVSKPIEEAVNPIAGVKHVSSVSREGVSTVVVEFELGVKIDDATQDARGKISAVRGDLPRDIEEPIIQKLDFAAVPVVSLALRSSALTPRQLDDLAEKRVRRRLENLAGVGKVDLVGPSRREVGVELRPDRLDALGLGVDEVIGGLRAENVNVPLGRLTGAGLEYPLRVAGKPAAVEGFAGMVIAEREGRGITLGEVARITDGVEEQRSLALVDGRPAIALDIIKQSGANTVAVVDAVKREMATLRAELPAGTTLDLVRDGSVSIRDSVRDVQETLLIGALLTVLIVFCFLNSWRSTVITGLTLPIAVISSFIVMNFMHMTLNMMTLMALSLAIGLLIDDAIVVRENIVRHLERGKDHLAAARDGTAEIGLAVLATTMSIVAVFVPVAFMKGIVGRFFAQFGITVAFAVLVSLFVSFTLDPMLSSRWVDPDIARRGRRNRIARALDRFNAWFDRTADRYRVLIGWALDHRRTVMLVAGGAFLAGLLAMGTLQTEFMPGFDQGEFQINFLAAPDASLAETRGRVEAVLTTLRALPEVEHTYATIGAGDDGTVRDAGVYVKLVAKSARHRSQEAIMRDVRVRLASVPGILPSLGMADQLDTRKPLLIYLRGEDLAVLKRYAAQYKAELYGIPGIVDLEVSLEADTPEYRITVDRERAADEGVNTTMVVNTLSTLVGGRVVTTFEDADGDAVDVRLRLPGDLRRDIGQIDALRLVKSEKGEPVRLFPLGDLIRHDLDCSPAQIDRQDLSRQVVISANLDGLPLGTAVRAAKLAAARLDMAPGYRIVFGGENETMDESFAAMGEALLLAIIMVYLILAAQFESFVDPLSIMLSLPLSVVGMAGMLLLTGDTVSIISLIGLIMLMGLVTKNAILLVDRARSLRAEGMPRREALIEAGRTRLRPIMMTTLAMIFGMLPLALALGAGAEMRAPMGRAVIGGLLTSTLLTLLVVPVVYSLLDDLVLAARRRRASARARTAGLPAALLALTLLTSAAVAGRAVAAASPPGVPPAGATSGDTLILTLPEALRLAEAHNRDLLETREYGRWVHGRYVEERAGALPKIELVAGASRQRDESQQALFGGLFPPQQDYRSAEARLSQALFTWGQVGAAIHAAGEGLAEADDRVVRATQTVRRDVTAAFCDVLLARELAAIARQNLDQRGRHLDEARRKYEEGTATDYDVLAARVAAENARPETIRAANAVRAALDRLRFLLAVEGGELEVAGSLDAAPAAPVEPAAALALALTHRPELASLEHQAAIARDVVRIYRAEDRPRLDLQAAYGRREYEIDGRVAAGVAWSAGVTFSFPIFDGLRTRGRVAQARSDLRTLEISVARQRDAIALEVRNATRAVEEAREIATALTGTVAQAEQLLRMAEDGFELGVTTRLDVEDAQLNLATARGNLARALRDRLVAETELARAQGTL